jgi:hypothetical protein
VRHLSLAYAKRYANAAAGRAASLSRGATNVEWNVLAVNRRQESVTWHLEQ